jgi:hypothetical protein
VARNVCWRCGRFLGPPGQQRQPCLQLGQQSPWSVAYRLVAGPLTYVLRLTCVASDDGTRVRIRQADSAVSLAVDLGRLPERIRVSAADPRRAAKRRPTR